MENMIAYKIGDKHIVYVEEIKYSHYSPYDSQTIAEVIHHVCDRDMTEYIAKRKDIPDICKMYDGIQQREQVLFSLGVVV